MQLSRSNITLRYPRPSDGERLFELARDPAVTGWFSWGPYEARSQADRWIGGCEDARERGHDLAFVIEDQNAGIVGVTSLNELSPRDRRAAVGTWIGREWWGTGINAQSKTLIFHLAFELCGLRRLTAYSDVENERSTRALERVGFTREGTLRRWHRHGDVEHDVHIFRLLPEEWPTASDVIVDGEPPPAWSGI
ncbi:MAG TPA: GNAT family N-acetyltransferase [Baekduia sp.]|nr:GNAT family N-acetyltransferase [Baekduia sp.]